MESDLFGRFGGSPSDNDRIELDSSEKEGGDGERGTGGGDGSSGSLDAFPITAEGESIVGNGEMGVGFSFSIIGRNGLTGEDGFMSS